MNRTGPPISGRRPAGLVLKLALADLIHEWILTLCLVLAVAAVLAPMMILFGLKSGAVETMRHRLVQDPRNREIRPLVSKSFEQEFFDKLRARPDVAFVVPTTRQISAALDAKLKGRRNAPTVGLDVIPTDDGDKLLLENGAPIPNGDQCVLSAPAGQALGAAKGDSLIVTAKRIIRGRYQKAKTTLTVAGVLDPRAGALKSIYVRLPMLEAVESYKDGRAVPKYGWPGDTAEAYPVYDGLFIALPRPLSKIDEIKLINNTGLTVIEEIPAQKLPELAGLSIAPPGSIYWLRTKKKPVEEESLLAVQRRLRGKHACLLPYVNGLTAELLGPEGTPPRKISLAALDRPLDRRAESQPIPEPPWPRPTSKSESIRIIMLPQGLAPAGGPARLRIKFEDREITFPVAVAAQTAPGSVALIPGRLAGIIRLFQTRNISYDHTVDQFILARRGYAGFRLYARTIDDVNGLKRHFESQGLTVSTEASRIRDVTELDQYLTTIFWLIALAASLGGAAALMASLYASVERKRRELGVLRLMGLSGATLFRFPVYQGLLVAGGGFGIGLAFFLAVAGVINTLFRAHLQTGESLCRLAPSHLGLALLGTLGIAAGAGIIAAWRATGVDPAEALRDE